MIYLSADIDDVARNIYLVKHEEWLINNPEFTQSPYTAVIAELYGQLPLFPADPENDHKFGNHWK